MRCRQRLARPLGKEARTGDGVIYTRCVSMLTNEGKRAIMFSGKSDQQYFLELLNADLYEFASKYEGFEAQVEMAVGGMFLNAIQSGATPPAIC
jgi:hypothetical protein